VCYSAATMRRARAQAVLFLVGAVVGTLGDQIHVQFDVLWYPRPLLCGQAPWVPFLFGTAALVLVNGHRLFLRRPAGDPPPSSLAAPAVLFVAAYFATALGKERPLLVAGGLAAAWALRVAVAPATDKLLAGLAIAAGGPLVEAALSATGAFFYRRPDVLGVPVWLPALYLHVSLLTRQIYLVFHDELGGDDHGP